MSDRKIEPREGIEVFVNERGTISIKQEYLDDEDTSVVVVHPDDVDRLIEFLKDTKIEALSIIKDKP